MIRFVGFAAVAAVLAGSLLLQLDTTARLVAWELFLVLLLVILWRLFPRSERDVTPPLFGGTEDIDPHPPRSVSSFELAAVHAFSESPGADRRLKVLMRRVARHRLGQKSLKEGSSRAGEVIDPILFIESAPPLTKAQLERIVDQLERL